MAVIEVETVESVNNLEALAEWVPFGRLKSPFHLYVPAAMVDVAKRLCTDSNIPVAEIHTYHWIGDEMRFLPVYKAPADGRARPARPRRSRPAKLRKAPKARSRKAASAARRSRRRSRPRKPDVHPNANSFAISAVHPRQARVRNNLARPCRPPQRAVAAAHSLLVSHAARRQGRPARAGRGRHPLDRRTQPRHRVRLAENSRGAAACCAARRRRAQPPAGATAIATTGRDPRRRSVRRRRQPEPSARNVRTRGTGTLEPEPVGTGTLELEPGTGTGTGTGTRPELEPEVVEAFEQLTHPEAEEKSSRRRCRSSSSWDASS